MVSPPPAVQVQLSRLDEYRPAALDPQIWSRNLAALSIEQPVLADELRSVELPQTWRPALALDDAVTFRLEVAGQPPEWLASTAAPRTRAEAMLSGFDAAGRNLALPSVGAGTELRYLLQHLPALVAVFAFESDLGRLAAALRIVDVSKDISGGRCVFIRPQHEKKDLTDVLVRYPGLAAPAHLLLPDLHPPARIEQLRALCEEVGRDIGERRVKLLCDLSAKARSAPEPASEPRLAVLALTADRSTHVLAGSLERAARQLGWPVLVRTTADARNVHPLPHCCALVEFGPTLTVCVNHPRSLLPLIPDGRVCCWLHDERSVPAAMPDEDTLYLAATPRVAEALRRAGARPDAVVDWFWGCDIGTATGPGADAARPEDRGSQPALLFGDLPDDRPTTYGVTQPTHRRLWQHLRSAAARVWESPKGLETDRLLTRAERESGVQITDRALRADLLRIIEGALLPGVALEQIAQTVAAAAALHVIGRGWQRLALGNCQILASDLLELPDCGSGLHPQAAIFAGPGGPLGPALLHAAASGWPLLVHCPGGRPLGPALGDVLRPTQHFEPFTTLGELRRALQAVRDACSAVRQRVERVRRHVREHHSYTHRLEVLTEVVKNSYVRRPS